MIPTETGWLQGLKRRHRYPGGWRETTQPTEAEKASIRALLKMQRRKLERDKPLALLIGGVEHGRRHYIHRLAGDLSGMPWSKIKVATIDEFLRWNTSVSRRRIRWGLYYNVEQFQKAWRKRRTSSRRTGRKTKIV